jgi:hypothetical protein
VVHEDADEREGAQPVECTGPPDHEPTLELCSYDGRNQKRRRTRGERS